MLRRRARAQQRSTKEEPWRHIWACSSSRRREPKASRRVPGRIDAARQLAKSLGGDLKEVYLAMGQFDLAAFIEAPNDEVVAKVLLATAQRGTVSTQTIRLFSEAEYRKLVAELP